MNLKKKFNIFSKNKQAKFIKKKKAFFNIKKKIRLLSINLSLYKFNNKNWLIANRKKKKLNWNYIKSLRKQKKNLTNEPENVYEKNKIKIKYVDPKFASIIPFNKYLVM